MKYIVCSWIMLVGFAARCYGGQDIDTTKVYSIPEVVVSDRYQTREVRSAAPLQIFSREELKTLNVMQVSDAVKHFSGVTVKDYGGIGGLKTVSIRSLGAQHTVVGYDGIAVTDCQTGQVDIGRFFVGERRPSDTKQRTGGPDFSACAIFRLGRNLEYPDTDSCFSRR